jgi:small conductance mechanosensitive channel
MEGELKTIGHVQSVLMDMALKFGPKVLVAILILVAGFMVGRYVGRAMDRSLHRFSLEPPVRQLLVRLVRVLVLGLFAIMALQNLGIELLPLIAGIGVAGAGLALATQGVLSNVVAGLTIIFTKPYRVGEFISIIGVEGTVETISLFSTVLRHADRSIVVVPNRKIVGEILHNYGKIRQTEVGVTVAFGADLSRAVATVAELLRANPKVLTDPAPPVAVSSVADSGVRIVARPWVAVVDFGVVESELNLRLVDAIRAGGIEMPSAAPQVLMLASPQAGAALAAKS